MKRLSCLLVLLWASVACKAAPDPLDRLVNAYGGREALLAADAFSAEWAGYFIGRHQSRHTEPPYDRLPIRIFEAFDFKEEDSVVDRISTWPGELNMGYRTVNAGEARWTINTISRIYTQGSMHGFDMDLASAAGRMPWLLVRRMLLDGDTPEAVGQREYLGIRYDELALGERRLLVHPDTGLIHVIESATHSMVDGETPLRRVYSHHFEHDGIMLNRRYQGWTGGEPGADLELAAFDRQPDLARLAAIPEGFVEVPSLDGYSGDWEIGVRELGEGIYLAGNGETRVLYVEFDDHFVAMEAGGMPGWAREVHESMQPHMDGKPLRYIVPTHHHDDHAIAVHYYVRAGATILTTRDKEGMLRRLLATSWDGAGPVENARFEFIDQPVRVLQDNRNRLDIHVYANAPHSENMLVGYVPALDALFTADIWIGWAGDSVRQGAPFGARHLARWIQQRQDRDLMGPVARYIPVHGRAYDAAEFAAMLATERTVTVLPRNETWPTAGWPARYGLRDDTVGVPRRDRVLGAPAPD